MKCEKYLNMIDDLVEGDLDRQTASQVNSHVSVCRNCEHCYETLKREREMYERYFEIEPSTKLWTEFQTKLKGTQTNNLVKPAARLRKVFDWKPNIFEHFRLTPALACAALLLLFGIGFGLSKLLSSKQVSETALVTEKESKSHQATGANFVETIKGTSQISLEETEISEDVSLQTKKKNGESEISSKRIVFDMNAKKSTIRKANTAKQDVSAKGKEFSAKAVRLNEKEQLPQLQERNLESEDEGDFYSLPFAGIREESKEELQILRVALPRSSLVALGVDLPVESEGANIKTDLLVSPDGVARAIRLLK